MARKRTKNLFCGNAMTLEEKNFWEDYKRRILNPIEILIQQQQTEAATKLMLVAIENFGSFRLGRGLNNSKNRVLPGGGGRSSTKIIQNGFEKQKERDAFYCFLKEYLRELFQYRHKLWEDFRNSMIHNGIIPLGYALGLVGKLITTPTKGKLTINVKRLYKTVTTTSLPAFDQELNDPEKGFVLTRWRARYKYLTNK